MFNRLFSILFGVAETEEEIEKLRDVLETETEGTVVELEDSRPGFRLIASFIYQKKDNQDD